MAMKNETAPCNCVEEERWPELVDLIHPSLSSLDYGQAGTKLRVVAATIAFCTAIVPAMHCFFLMTSDQYRKLGLKHKIFWTTSVVRGIFGTFCTVVGTWAIFGNTRLEEDILWRTTPTSHMAVCITVGFFIFENITLTLSDVYFRTFSFMLHLHHWLTFAGFVSVLLTDHFHTMACKCLILELSTPFSALCWTLLKCGKEKSLVWKVNQFILVHTFHLRSVAECMLWYISYRNWGYIWSGMSPWMFYLVYFQLLLASVLYTPHWAYQKTKQMIIPVDWNFKSEITPKPMEVLVPSPDEDKQDTQEAEVVAAANETGVQNSFLGKGENGRAKGDGVRERKLMSENHADDATNNRDECIRDNSLEDREKDE